MRAAIALFLIAVLTACGPRAEITSVRTGPQAKDAAGLYPADRDVLKNLADNGDMADCARPIDHFLYPLTAGADVAPLVDAIAARDGWTARPGRLGGVHAVFTGPATVASGGAQIALMEELGAAHRFNYDGWGAPVVPAC